MSQRPSQITRQITILAVGSRGDVQPMLALGLGLKRAGHQVTLAALDVHAPLVASHGLRFASLGSMPSRFSSSSNRRAPGFHGLTGRLFFWAVYSRLLPSRLQAFQEACQGADAIVMGGLAFPGYHLAEVCGVPCFWASPVPHTATDAFVDPFFSDRWFGLEKGPRETRSPWGARLHQWSYLVEEQLRVQSTARLLNRWRQEHLGLPHIARRDLLSHKRSALTATLYGCSPLLVPRPTDWPADTHITGHWHLPQVATWTPPKALQEFLAAGPPPVCISFGAMTSRDPQGLHRLAVEALSASGHRGILLGAAHTTQPLPRQAVAFAEAPHEWLLPQCAALVHHGGAGTTVAAIRAGIPALVVPFSYDQFFWAARAEQLGVASSLPYRQLTSHQLGQGLDLVTHDSALKQQAQHLARRICAEDGVDEAVSIMEAHLA